MFCNGTSNLVYSVILFWLYTIYIYTVYVYKIVDLIDCFIEILYILNSIVLVSTIHLNSYSIPRKEELVYSIIHFFVIYRLY